MINVPPSVSSAFVTLLATIGPVETAAVFAAITHGVHRLERRQLASRSIMIAGVVLVCFAIGGSAVLAYLHVSIPAFRVAGGALLFLQALTLTFSRSGLSSISEGQAREAEEPGDIAVFPLAFPVIASPGALVAVVLLMSRAESTLEHAVVVIMLLACLGLTYAAMKLGDLLALWLGRIGVDVVGRISGVLLAGVAVQFIFDGVREAIAGAAGVWAGHPTSNSMQISWNQKRHDAFLARNPFDGMCTAPKGRRSCGHVAQWRMWL